MSEELSAWGCLLQQQMQGQPATVRFGTWIALLCGSTSARAGRFTAAATSDSDFIHVGSGPAAQEFDQNERSHNSIAQISGRALPVPEHRSLDPKLDFASAFTSPTGL
ncbi:hypothetical protein BC832DRAFT_537881 [Gaertneriomyces semiglobifer]|nr:hypothetical protein BC832DRAFT_537881 [Gaertneriomyces semiglobifer]